MKAIALEEKCMGVASEWSGELKTLNSKLEVKQEDCEKLNEKFKLGVGNECCKDMWSQGCAFTAVRGGQDVTSSVCRQYKAPLQGPNQACHYGNALYDPKKDRHTGREVVQNKANANHVICTKW